MRLVQSPRIRESPFYEATVAAGADSAGPYNGMILPYSYGDPAAEHDRLMNGVAMWDVAAERQVEVKGPDAAACVQYLTARDLTGMATGQGKYVAVCAHDGELLNDPVLLKLNDEQFWFSIADSDYLLFAKAIAGERGYDVEVSEPDVSPLAVQGPFAEDVVASMFGDEVRSLKYFWFVESEFDGIPVVVCRSGWSKQGGFELFLRDGSRGIDLWNAVEAAGAAYGIGPGAPNGIERIESGLLSYGGDTTPGSNPFECGMARYVQTDIEPDFVGKAALQRIKAEGPERLFVGLVLQEGAIDWPMGHREEVRLDGEVVGTMSGVANSRRVGAVIGVAQIRADVVAAGAAVQVTTPAGIMSAEIRTLPFV